MPAVIDRNDQDSATHHAFADIIDRFGVLVRRQVDLRGSLPVPELGTLRFDETRFLNGDAMVTMLAPDIFLEPFLQAAPQVWPVMRAAFPELAEPLSLLADRLGRDSVWAGLCLKAVAGGDAEALLQAAIQAKVTPEFLLTALRAVWAPVIGAARPTLAALAPMDLWRKSYCPVCGSDPDLGLLENHPDPSEFLVSKSGEMWHHCPACGYHWRYVRMICPGCSNQEHDRLTRYTLPGAGKEHIYACEDCRQYLPCLDLVERRDAVDLDLAALHLVHLDAVAQTRGYTPLSPAPWALLGLGEVAAKAS